jgi:hypothetical protein
VAPELLPGLAGDGGSGGQAGREVLQHERAARVIFPVQQHVADSVSQPAAARGRKAAEVLVAPQMRHALPAGAPRQPRVDLATMAGADDADRQSRCSHRIQALAATALLQTAS